MYGKAKNIGEELNKIGKYIQDERYSTEAA